MSAADDPFNAGWPVNEPMPYLGTVEDLLANHRSHAWSDDPDHLWFGYCESCGSKPSHVAASWPCGIEPTRCSR